MCVIINFIEFFYFISKVLHTLNKRNVITVFKNVFFIYFSLIFRRLYILLRLIFFMLSTLHTENFKICKIHFNKAHFETENILENVAIRSRTQLVFVLHSGISNTAWMVNLFQSNHCTIPLFYISKNAILEVFLES